MRYTEVRQQKMMQEMVKDINKNTVDFIPNFDGEEKEPSVLPSRFPNLLVNGSSGIAVGMATNIPPHNLTEVDRKSTRLNSSHANISYAVFCLKKKTTQYISSLCLIQY